MKYLFFSLLLAGCSSSMTISPYKNIDNTNLYYEFSVQELVHTCEFDENLNNCLCSIRTKSSPGVEWVLRKARENEWCHEFNQIIEKILTKNDKVKILGYDVPSGTGRNSELQYFGAIKGLNNCIEWFEGDCETF